MAYELMEAETDTAERLERLSRDVEALQRRARSAEECDTVCVVCFSGDWDKLFAAFTIANGALALGQEVHMFFTFWGACALRQPGADDTSDRNWVQRALGVMLPQTIADSPLSKMNFLGISKLMLKRLMRKSGIDDLPSLMQQARELGAQFHCCETSMRLFGWSDRDMDGMDASDLCGVTTFMSMAMKSRTTLFI